MSVFFHFPKSEVVTDEIGNHKNEWKPYYTCYATVSAEAGKEMTQAGMVVDDSSVDFTIRYCEKAKAINTTKYRVEFNGELYNIEGVDHIELQEEIHQAEVAGK